MTADDLPAAFASLPAPWQAVLPGWTPAATAAVCDRVRVVSGSRPIAPADPFRALRLVSPERARVVIFGQDPYPLAGDADGLAFSSQGVPRSLQRIFDVLQADRPGWVRPASGKLDRWAEQGVLLLNPILTVEVGPKRALSHQACGWQALTAGIVQALCVLPAPPVFLLWGDKAARFFDRARPADRAVAALRTRHPSYDIHRQFMAEGSHFSATADRVNWWRLTGPD
jgi:uracil-DNA glycosylase